MAAGVSWDSTRWRNGQYQLHPRWDSSRDTQHPQLAAPVAINPASQSSVLDGYTYEARPETRTAPEITAPSSSALSSRTTHSYNDLSPYSSRPAEIRHTPAPGGHAVPQQLANSPPHQTFARPWRSLHHGNDNRRASVTQQTEAPLTLFIPNVQGSYCIS